MLKRIDVTFEIWTSLAEAVVGPETVIEGAPPWLTLACFAKTDAPELFQIPTWVEEQTEDDVLADLRRAAMLYRVRVAPETRPENDSHLQAAIQVAATIAEASGGWVLDALAERVLDAEEMESSCQPEIANHVSYTLFDHEVRTLGLAKLGLPDVSLRTDGVVEQHEATLVGVLDAITSGFAGGVFSIAAPFELAGTSFRFELHGDVVVAAPIGIELVTFVADLARLDGEPN
ncbi:MAG: hypothetical protein IPI67_02090 [Myxococcales bacterium]|nr:hypothetical protein [Myxococcales bacterium]